MTLWGNGKYWVRVAMVCMQNLRRAVVSPIAACGLGMESYFRHPPSCISTERLPTPRILNFVDQHSLADSAQEVLSRWVEFALELLVTVRV